ncbi:MAG: TM2 domain-containing protein [Clostridia bacterium]|nr:TM2 domain-containing protein [Clostridia bacterium]MDD4686138.1 TM2 domain-containing protein [Clostridia bacterium]
MSNEKLIKKCPRCKQKTYANMIKCPNCKLVFERLKYASNQEAKRAIVNKENEKVLLTNQFPSDLKRWLAGILCAFGGYLGLHNFYVGRYYKAAFSFLFSLLFMVLLLVLEPSFQAYLFKTWLLIPAALVFYFWFYDLILIAFNKYKVPIALKLPENNKINTK